MVPGAMAPNMPDAEQKAGPCPSVSPSAHCEVSCLADDSPFPTEAPGLAGGLVRRPTSRPPCQQRKAIEASALALQQQMFLLLPASACTLRPGFDEPQASLFRRVCVSPPRSGLQMETPGSRAPGLWWEQIADVAVMSWKGDCGSMSPRFWNARQGLLHIQACSACAAARDVCGRSELLALSFI